MLVFTAAGQTPSAAKAQASGGANSTRATLAPLNTPDKSVMVLHAAAGEKSSTAHPSSHQEHKATANVSHMSDQKAAYRTALKRCVAGPADRRDTCLNDTIARYRRP